jgi:hypothetical protein
MDLPFRQDGRLRNCLADQWTDVVKDLSRVDRRLQLPVRMPELTLVLTKHR